VYFLKDLVLIDVDLDKKNIAIKIWLNFVALEKERDNLLL
jgi:hypothetical protein